MRATQKIQVAILDTGLDLAQCPVVTILQSRSFVGGRALSAKHEHGTLMLRIFLQALEAQALRPTPELLIAQVMNEQGIGTVTQMVRAFEWLLNFTPQLILIPSGFQYPPFQLYPILKKIKTRTFCTIVAAAGNLYAHQKQALYPAAWPEVVSVGCSMDRTAYTTWETPPDVIIDFSNYETQAIIRDNESTSAACMLWAAEWLAG